MSGKIPLVLIVEDREEIAQLWTKSLSPLCFDLVWAKDMNEAFNRLRNIPPPDMVLLDLNLGPDQTAPRTVSQIAEIRSFNPNMVLLVISGVLDPNIINTAFAQGADSVREKIDMGRQVELWKEIDASLKRVPDKARSVFAHTMTLLETITSRVSIF